MGDYNVNTLTELKGITMQMQELSTFHYNQLINLPTRERNQLFILLDNIQYYIIQISLITMIQVHLES